MRKLTNITGPKLVPKWTTRSLPFFSALCGSCSTVNSSTLTLAYISCHSIWGVITWSVLSHLFHFSSIPYSPIFLHLLFLTLSHTTAHRGQAGCPLVSGSIFHPILCEFLAVEGYGMLWSHASSSPARRQGFSPLQPHAPCKGWGRLLSTFCLYGEAERQPREKVYLNWHAGARSGLTQFFGILSQILSPGLWLLHACRCRLTSPSGKAGRLRSRTAGALLAHQAAQREKRDTEADWAQDLGVMLGTSHFPLD